MDFLSGRFANILFAIPFLVFGVMHFMGANEMAHIVPAWLPMPVFWVYITGIALIAGAVAIIIEKYACWACLGLAAMLLVFIVTIHIPSVIANENMPMPVIAILKDLAMLAGCLILGRQFHKA